MVRGATFIGKVFLRLENRAEKNSWSSRAIAEDAWRFFILPLTIALIIKIVGCQTGIPRKRTFRWKSSRKGWWKLAFIRTLLIYDQKCYILLIGRFSAFWKKHNVHYMFYTMNSSYNSDENYLPCLRGVYQKKFSQ